MGAIRSALSGTSEPSPPNSLFHSIVKSTPHSHYLPSSCHPPITRINKGANKRITSRVCPIHQLAKWQFSGAHEVAKINTIKGDSRKGRPLKIMVYVGQAANESYAHKGVECLGGGS